MDSRFIFNGFVLSEMCSMLSAACRTSITGCCCYCCLMRRTMVTQLVQHERIQTTLAKAKELRKVADKVVTLAKKVGN
jgi:hypothetical protein